MTLRLMIAVLFLPFCRWRGVRSPGSPGRTDFFSLGVGGSYVGSFVSAQQYDAGFRQPSDGPGTHRDPVIAMQLGWIEGFVSGMNIASATGRVAGPKVSTPMHAFSGS